MVESRSDHKSRRAVVDIYLNWVGQIRERLWLKERDEEVRLSPKSGVLHQGNDNRFLLLQRLKVQRARRRDVTFSGFRGAVAGFVSNRAGLRDIAVTAHDNLSQAVCFLGPDAGTCASPAKERTVFKRHWNRVRRASAGSAISAARYPGSHV